MQVLSLDNLELEVSTRKIQTKNKCLHPGSSQKQLDPVLQLVNKFTLEFAYINIKQCIDFIMLHFYSPPCDGL